MIAIEDSHNLRQVRAPGAAWVIVVPRQLARAVRLGLKVEQLRVNAVAFDETVKRIAPASAALVALYAQHVELAGNVAEDDRAVSGHANNVSLSSEFLGSASEAHCPARLGPGGAFLSSEVEFATAPVTEEVLLAPVPVGYSNSNVPMVKPTQDWQGEHASYPLGIARDRCVLLQR